MADKIQLRRDTYANWTSSNPILSSGEIGFETDKNRAKIGDGTTLYNSLNYLNVNGYKTYVAMFSSSSFTPNVLKNDIGTITVSKVSTGHYRLSSSSLFVSGKTFILSSNNESSARFIDVYLSSSSAIDIYVWTGTPETPVASDISGDNVFSIKIDVYD